jgi:ATP-dependent Clp protease ATP-binding subunit ClpA
MFERFTERARWVVSNANAEANDFGHPYVGSEHLLLAMLKDTGLANGVLTGAGLTYGGVRTLLRQALGPSPLGPEDAEALSAIGIDLDAVLAKMAETFGDDARGSRPPGQRVPFGPRSKKVLGLSLREALAHRHNYIGTEHILLGLIRDGDGLGARLIVDSGVQLADLRAATEAAMQRAA